MIKQMLEYTDIEGQRTTRTVMFNLTQFEIEGEMELELIQARFQRFQDEVVSSRARKSGTISSRPVRSLRSSTGCSRSRNVPTRSCPGSGLKVSIVQKTSLDRI
jgi:hypothetical protein